MNMHPRSGPITRRAMLTTMLAGTAGALMTACGSSAPAAAPAATTAPKPTDAPKPAAPAAASPATAASPAAGASPGAAASPAASPAAGPSPAASPAAAARPVTAPVISGNYEVTFLTTQTSPADVKIYEELASKFHEQYSNLTVKITAESGTNIDQKLLTYLTAGTLPDIVHTSDNFAKPYKDNKITQNMIPFAEKYGFPWQDFDPTFLNLGIVDGELHMLPKQGDVIIPYINLRMAKEAGVTPPLEFDPVKDPNGWTWDDFEKLYKRLTVDGNGKRGDEPGFDKENVAIYGASVAVDQWYIYVPLVLGEGGQFVSDDLSKSLLNSPAGIAAFKKLTQPMVDGYWAPLSLIQTMNNQSGNVFAAGQAAISLLQRLWCTTLRSTLTDDFDVMHFPKGPAKRVAGMGTFGFALSTSAKNPDAAWAFLQFMYGEEGMKIITSSYASVPAMKRFYDSPFWRDLPGPPYHNNVFVDAFSYGTTPPRVPFYSTGPFRQAVTDGIVAVVLGKSTVEDVVANVDSELNKILQARR
jgi:multiple sugar transport system substrate-binding protein